MLFFARWHIPSEVRDRVIDRFIQTQSAPPDGVRLIGRWHRADGSGGYAVMEADSMRPVTDFAYEWNDLLFIEIVPVVGDADLALVLEKLKARAERDPDAP